MEIQQSHLNELPLAILDQSEGLGATAKHEQKINKERKVCYAA